MSQIKIKNFGPVKTGYRNSEWLDIKKVTVFIGNQGSGKSITAKLISTFTWMEKALVRGDKKAKEFEKEDEFRKNHCAWQNIHHFFRKDSEIEFRGEAWSFLYKNSVLKVEENKTGRYLVPKIMYVPAERNFVSAIAQPEKLKYLPHTLYTFLDEFIRSNEEMEENIQLPVNNLHYTFDKKKRSFKLSGNEYEILLSEASSGLQSSIPLFLVSKNLSEGINKENSFAKSALSVEEKEKIRNQLLEIITNNKVNGHLQSSAVDLLSGLTKNDCFINIVEEPEQNLFPLSQQKMLHSLLEFNGQSPGNKLIMTTHSPYLINYLTLAVKANALQARLRTKEDFCKLYEIVPENSTLRADDLVIYEFNEDGSIKRLEVYDGLPSDENELNVRLGESNDLFARLLEIEQGL